MAFTPSEYGGGTYLINTNSIPANQTGYQQLCSITLSKGKWIVTAVTGLPTTNNKYTTRLEYTDTTQTSVVIIDETAGSGSPYSSTISEIVNIENQSNKNVLLWVYTNTVYTGTFKGRLQAIKIED